MKIYWYIAVMAITTYLVRMLPFTIFQKKITNRFVRSFLDYVPCACLAAMTFPAIIYATNYVVSGVITLIAAIFLSLKGNKLIVVAAASCVTVLAVETVMRLLA